MAELLDHDQVGLLNRQPTLGPGDGDYSSCPIADIQRRHPDGVDGWKLVKALDLLPADQLPDRTARHRASAPDAVAIAQRRRIGALVTALNEVWTRLTPAPRRLIQKVRRQGPCDRLSSAEWARENAGLWRCCFEGTSC